MEQQQLENIVSLFVIEFEDTPDSGFIDKRCSSIEEENGNDNITENTNGNKQRDLYIYQPGDRLKGWVRMLLNTDAVIVNLLLNVEGAVTLNSHDDVGQKIDIFNVTTTLLVSDDDQYSTLTTGEHIFPFEFVLPIKCPSTINMAPEVNLAYIIKAILQGEHSGDRNSEIPSIIAKKGFVITHRLLNLNIEYALQPFHADIQKCKIQYTDNNLYKGLLTKFRGFVHLNRRAFEQGERIEINSEIINTSNQKTITGVLAKLTMDVCYQGIITENGVDKHKASKIVTYTLDNHNIGHKQCRKWKNVHLQIPLYLPASGYNGSQFYSVEYHLQFEIKFQSMDKPIPFIRVPVVIGTQIPLELKIATPDQLDNNNAGDRTSLAGYNIETAKTAQMVKYAPQIGQYANNPDY